MTGRLPGSGIAISSTVMVPVRPKPTGRFNVLLTEDRDHLPGHWTRQLPRLLQPQGVRAFVAHTAEQAVEMTTEFSIHAALIDLTTPRANLPDGHDVAHPDYSGGGGLWLLEVMRRTQPAPPIVVVNSTIQTPNQAQRFLNKALQLGAFSVVNRPVELEALLDIIHRLLKRHHHGQWPVND